MCCADELEEGECEVERAEKTERRRVNMEHLSQNIHESVDMARIEADGGERRGERVHAGGVGDGDDGDGDYGDGAEGGLG